MRYLVCSFILLTALACKENLNQKVTEKQALKIGKYLGVLELEDDVFLPFNFEVYARDSLKIRNAEEVIAVDDIFYSNDSVYIKPPVFEGYIAAQFEGEHLKGRFIIESLDRVVPFSATYDTAERFLADAQPLEDVSGIWETVFSPDTPADAYSAKGVFKQRANRVTGTFRTTTGDYRYLEGVMDGDTMKLSAFDGAHAFLFTAKVTDSTMEGTFYSGNHWKEPFVAKRNANFELPDANSLTYLKPGYERLDFSFPNTSGKLISLKDNRFKDKVVVVQIMGTWCPNCLDESKYYAQFYNTNKDKDVEFIALAFEYAKDKATALKGIKRLQTKIGVNYPVLLAQYGTSDKVKAQEKLPMLNHILSYPTTIFIDKKGKVRKIHTGFNGPATGEKYTAFQTEFEDFINTLLGE